MKIILCLLLATSITPALAQLSLPWEKDKQPPAAAEPASRPQAPATPPVASDTPPANATAPVPAADRGIRLVVPKQGTSELRGDLAGNGDTLVVTWTELAPARDIGRFFQVKVADANARVLWSSPVTEDANHPLAFGSWDFGLSLPVALADLDGDGRQELIVPAPQSDVSPTSYRVFRWMGTELKPGAVRSLAGNGGLDTIFTWQSDVDASQFWVSEWLSPEGEAMAVVRLAHYPDGGHYEIGTAMLTRSGIQFRRESWVKKPARPKQ